MRRRRRLWPHAILVLFVLMGGLQACQIEADEPAPLNAVWIIGDSITRGLYASNEAAMFRHHVFTDLQDRHPGQIRLLFWEGMCTLGRLEARWERLEPLPPPTILFIELGVNDILPSPTCEQVPEAEWQARYGAMLDRFRQLAPQAQIIVGTTPWVGWDDERRARAQLYNGWIHQEAEARGLAVADLWAATVDRPDGLSSPDQPNPFPPDFHGDGFHPNDLGHQRIADAFLSAYYWHYARDGLTYFPLIAGGDAGRVASAN